MFPPILTYCTCLAHYCRKERPQVALSKDLMLMKWAGHSSIEPLAFRPLQRNITWEQPVTAVQFPLMLLWTAFNVTRNGLVPVKMTLHWRETEQKRLRSRLCSTSTYLKFQITIIIINKLPWFLHLISSSKRLWQMAFASSHSPSPQMACFVLSDILFKKVKQKKAANHHIGPFFFFFYW